MNLTVPEETRLISKVIRRNDLKNQKTSMQGGLCKTVNFILAGCTKPLWR